MKDLSRTQAYDYELDPSRIARYPVARRDRSRLLVVPRSPDGPGSIDPGRVPSTFQDLLFADLVKLVAEGDVVVVNQSRVLPVRLSGRKPTGAECEVLLLRPVEPLASGHPMEARRWEALVRPGSKLKPGRRVVIADDLSLTIEDGTASGGRIVRLESSQPVRHALELHGKVPLPPYLGRPEEPLDRERYQTVYARDPGSVAAPTAGLHFTPELLKDIENRGAEIARVSLHVGPGTFRPVDSETIEGHAMHAESWEISREAAQIVAEARSRGGRVWAVGTTVVRTLETAAAEAGLVRAGSGDTDLFIRPGYRFRVVDALITNFHLPKSTLLMLVAAFAGYEVTMDAYRHATKSGYRFYSYGDAMAIVPSRG